LFLMTTPANPWDAGAATYDNEPDHGLRDPDARAAWNALLETHLPAAVAEVLDAGCGTGSLSLLMREQGHRVTGIDASGPMLDLARAKLDAAGLPMPFHQMDASRPDFPAGSFDVVLSRHVLWMFDDLPAVLDRWLSLVRPGGKLLLIEGFWHTGGGLHAQDLLHALDAHPGASTLIDLSTDARFWGGEVHDERYLVVFTSRSVNLPS
jgi:SAM-dependent methyltransferase